MSSDFLLSIGIGVLVTCAVYVGLRRALGADRTVRRAVAVFAAAGGIVVTLFLRQRPALLEEQGAKIVLALIGVVLALIATARRHQ
jgi:hypothetical protein